MNDPIFAREIYPTGSKFQTWLYRLTRKIAPVVQLEHAPDGVRFPINPRVVKMSDYIEWMVERKLAILSTNGYRENSHVISRSHYNREMASMHINCGRRCGHTTAARRIMLNLWRSNRTVHVIFPNRIMQQHFWKNGEIQHLYHVVTGMYPRTTMVLSSQNDLYANPWLEDDAVNIFDCAVMFKPDLIEQYQDACRPLLSVFLE